MDERSIRPPDITPNPNDPAAVPPGSVGPPSYNPGDPSGLVPDFSGDAAPPPPPLSRPMPWSGWPADWWTPGWNSGRWGDLVDTAWVCIDLNANLLCSMPPYLVDAAPTTPADWLNNPSPDLYSSWEEFAKQLFWDYQLGEAFVIATAYYSTGWPARFHVVPGYMVSVEWDYQTGTRRYSIGGLDVTEDLLHIRYRSVTGNAHGMGPLDAMESRIIAAGVLMRYATNLATSGGIPSSILTHPEELNAAQASKLQAQWVNARMSHLGEPAVISGGATWQSVAINPKDMALHDLATFNEARIAVALGVPPFLVGLPSGADTMTYKNLINIYDYHWRAGLRPKAQMVMAALSGWLLPRGTRVEVNRDAYVEPDPLERAQTAQILHGIQDPDGNPALTVAEIRASERLTNSTPNDLSAGVLK